MAWSVFATGQLLSHTHMHTHAHTHRWERVGDNLVRKKNGRGNQNLERLMEGEASLDCIFPYERKAQILP